VSIRRVFLILFGLQLVSIGVFNTIDPDMWWHLRTGELIWTQGIPRHDPFSFTVAGGEWITHEWLSEALMWAFYRVGGLQLTALGFLAAATSRVRLVTSVMVVPQRPVSFSSRPAYCLSSASLASRYT